jgi:putative PIN family toxin of toxin-antitoxin system
VRVVFDTNIFISAFVIPGGRAEEAIRHAVHNRFELVTSVAILTETANILQSKFNWSQEKIESLLEFIGRVADVLKTQPHLHVLQDDPDNRILECAVAAGADVVVTGDKHLLSLREYQGIPVQRLADFLATIGTKKT